MPSPRPSDLALWAKRRIHDTRFETTQVTASPQLILRVSFSSTALTFITRHTDSCRTGELGRKESGIEGPGEFEGDQTRSRCNKFLVSLWNWRLCVGTHQVLNHLNEVEGVDLCSDSWNYHLVTNENNCVSPLSCPRWINGKSHN